MANRSAWWWAIACVMVLTTLVLPGCYSGAHDGEDTVATTPGALDPRGVGSASSGTPAAPRPFAMHASGAWVAVGAALTTTVDAHGGDIAATGAPLHLRLRLARVGRAGQMRETGDSAPAGRGTRIDVPRGAGVSEWWVNAARGVEHGVDIATRPDGGGDLVAEVAVAGLIPLSDRSGATIALLDAAGQPMFEYANLVVHDADGQTIPSAMHADGEAITIRVDDRNARYPIIIDPLVTTIEGQMKPTAASNDAGFGFSVAVDAASNTLVVGADWFSGAWAGQGAVYVYSLSYPLPNSVAYPTLQAILTASDPQINARLGWSVATSGDTIVVSAAGLGTAYVFVRNGTIWTQQAKLPGASKGVAISGNTILLGNSSSTSAAVWVRSGTTWTQQAAFTGSGGFGDSVSLSGNLAAIGAPSAFYGGITQGVVHVFERTGTTWSGPTVITASNATSGSGFGTSVSLSGTTLVVGAPYVSAAAGAAYVFTQTASNWQQQAVLFGVYAGDHFGASLGLSGGALVVGVPGAPTTSPPVTSGAGAAYVYVGSGASWSYAGGYFPSPAFTNGGHGSAVAVSGTVAVIGFTPSFNGNVSEGVVVQKIGNYGGAGQPVPHDGDRMGHAVAISGSTTIVGGPNSLRAGQMLPLGSAAVFTRNLYNNGTLVKWEQQQELASPDGGDRFGWSVAISGDTAIIGTLRWSNGAAFVYARTANTWSMQQKIVCPDAGACDYFGSAVAISGDTAIVSAYARTVGANPGQGTVYVFTRNGATWTGQASIVAPDGKAGDGFGASLAYDGTTLVVGTASSPAAAYVWAGSGSSWTPQAKLPAEKACAQGAPVAVRGDTLIVNGPGAKVYFRSGTSWNSQSQLTPGGVSAVAYDGNVALTYGGCGESKPVQVFVRNAGTWSQQATFNPGASDVGFGVSLALGVPYAVIGAPNTTVGMTPNEGVGYAYGISGAPGATCAIDSDCATSFSCVDGVCCASTACAVCHSCAASLQTPGGVNGICRPSMMGTDPHDDCPGLACSGATQEDAHACNGAGACVATSTKSCAPYICGAIACKSSCVDDADCDAGHYCSGSQCVPKLAQGETCTAGNQCPSGVCTIDHVCCDKACTGVCEACVMGMTGKLDGTCAPVTAGTDPHGDCGTAVCTGSTMIGNLCNGLGVCTAQPKSCGLYVCADDGKECRKTCSVDTDCVVTAYCGSGACIAQEPKGADCTADSQCANNGVCVDGVCCNAPCTGQCEACDIAGHVGTCWPVEAGHAPHGNRPSCLGNLADVCAGACDGTNGAACSYADASQQCGTSCTDGSQTIDVCDSHGSCQPGEPIPCAGGFACDGTTKCKTICATDDDCAVGYVCAGTTCAPKGGAKCSDDGLFSVTTGGVSPCSPYRCDVSSGVCKQVCTRVDDCTTENECDLDSHSCVPIAVNPPTDVGCSCRLDPHDDNVSWTSACVLMLALRAFRRKRRGRTWQHSTSHQGIRWPYVETCMGLNRNS